QCDKPTGVGTNYASLVINDGVFESGKTAYGTSTEGRLIVNFSAQTNKFTTFEMNGGEAKLWCDLLGEKAVMVNDDKPLIRVGSNKATVYGTPYNGKHRRGNNMAVPLKAICYLTRSETNSIEEVSSKDLYHILLQQIYRPGDKELLIKTVSLIDKLTKEVKFYILKCNMDISAAKTSYNAMKG
ncbi:MAG: hypothetical protein IKH76_02225, partial [Clostridiales bacterium]|nr:hypothetical protein [Clostridiales bacterium]